MFHAVTVPECAGVHDPFLAQKPRGSNLTHQTPRPILCWISLSNQLSVLYSVRCDRLRDSNVSVDPLGRVDVHFKRITVAARAMNALKLASVLQQRIAIPLYSLSFPKKFSIRCRHI